MKTVILSANTSWYLHNFRAGTIARLVAEGYRVICLAPKDAYSERLERLGCEWLPLPMDNDGANPLRDAMLFARFWRCYSAVRPSAVFHFTVKNNIYGTLAAGVLKIPAINNVSGLGTAFIRDGAIGMLVRALYRLSQPLAHRVFCQNSDDYRLLSEKGLVPAERLTLLPGSGVDLQRFHPGLQRRRDAGDGVRFLYAGRMLADKGLRELVQAFRRLREEGSKSTLWLCGFAGCDNVSAIPTKVLEEWGRQPGVRWLGPSDSIEDIYSEADCVVLPSYREGMPRSLLEAAAMGLPVIATDVPGCREIVQNGINGVLCEPAHVGSLLDALKKMEAFSAEDRQRMGRAGRMRVEAEFGEHLVIGAALSVLDGLPSHPPQLETVQREAG